MQPFHIGIPQAQLDDLDARLSATRWPDQIPNTPWECGAPLDHLDRLAEAFRDMSGYAVLQPTPPPAGWPGSPRSSTTGPISDTSPRSRHPKPG
ncbi:epoxide hydrolase N-terminal domain-containing protein [Flindersiella endophytica]